MPFPNEHACRIRDPGGFQKGSFRRIKQGKLSIIIGKLQGKKTTTTQSFRYPKKSWTASAARAHCKRKKGRFEAAKKEIDTMDVEPIEIEVEEKEVEEKDENKHAQITYFLPLGATSFSDVDEYIKAQEVQERVKEITRQFGDLSWNILHNEEIGDKATALRSLVNELDGRLGEAITEAGKSKSLADRVKGFIGIKEEPKEPEPTSSLFFWKEGDRYRFMAIYSNKYRDEDSPPEILAEASHERFMKEVEAGEFPYPELWHWHIPGTKWGQSDWLHYDKETGFMLASGYVDKGHENEADAIMAMKEPVKVSHGMPAEYIEREKDDETIITRYVSKEISDLPAEVAANQLTGFSIFKEVDMSIPDDKKEYLRSVDMSDTAIQKVEEELDDKAKLAMEAGLEHKEADVAPADDTEEPKEEPEGKTEEPTEPQYATREEVAEAITEVVAPIVEMVSATLETVKQLAKDDDLKIAEIVVDTPKESIASIVARNLRAVGDERTKVDGRTVLGKDGPKETQPEINRTGVQFIDEMLSEEPKE